MSLNWNVTKCDRSKVFEPAKADDPQNNIKQGDEILRAVTHRIIWATLSVDIGEITEKNWKEFYARVGVPPVDRRHQARRRPLYQRAGCEGPHRSHDKCVRQEGCAVGGADLPVRALHDTRAHQE